MQKNYGYSIIEDLNKKHNIFNVHPKLKEPQADNVQEENSKQYYERAWENRIGG